MKGPLAPLALLALGALALIGASTTSAFAADPAPAVDGELHVTLKNTAYVKVQVNGEDYENIEFERDGKVVLIKGLSLSLERNAIVLLPTDGALKQAEVEVLQKDFKKQRKGREVFLVASKQVAFEKSTGDAPPPTPDAPKKPDPIAPPPPDKDL